MSGQWEVVGKKKDKNGKINKQAAIREQQQQKLVNGVSVEEVLPMSQLKNLYNSKNNKENRKPAKEKAAKKESSNKEKSQKQHPKKSPQETKTKQFKSIDNAFHSIKVDDLSAVYDKNKVVYPATPIVWLREVAQFLNSNIIVDTPDVTFSSKPDYYPLCVMPTSLRSVLEKGLKQAGAENCALFYDICLTSMANDMNKNLAAIGHKVFIQLLSQQYPKLSVGNIVKYATLRNSYQNRPNIGMSILWALGQGGLKDLNVGLKVFQDIMYPLLDMKNYTRDVLKYLMNLLRKHAKSASSLTKEQYLFLTDLVYANKKNMTPDLTKELYEVMPICNDLLVLNDGPYFTYVEPLMLKLGQAVNKAYKNHLCSVLSKCIQKDHTCLNAWGNIYTKNLIASANLIVYIDQHWRTISGSIDVKKLKGSLTHFMETNEELESTKQKDIPGLSECMNGVKHLNNKMADGKRKGRSCFRFFTYSTLLLIGAFVFYDVKQNGGWSNSSTSKALNRTGVYGYTNKAYDCASECTQWMHIQIEDTFPGITATTIKHTTPYIELGRDLGIIGMNIINNAKEATVARWPLVVDTIETHAPGLIKKTQEIGKSVWAASVIYFESGKDYLLTKVLVGKLAPEEIQKTLSTSFEIATEKAHEYYSWLCNKILTAVK